MTFDIAKEMAEIERMKAIVRGHFDKSTANNAKDASLEQRNGAASSARAYAELVQAQAALVQASKQTEPVARPASYRRLTAPL